MKRFVDNKDGTITDNDTGLVWLKDASIVGRKTKTWKAANNACKKLRKGGKSGWRLPTRLEFESLLDLSRCEPALPKGHPFTGVYLGRYWSSTTYAGNTHFAWYMYLSNGHVSYGDKAGTIYVWPVRGGKKRS